MLSAVAARKAALAQSQGNENISFPPTTSASLNKQKSTSKPAAPKPPSLPKRKSSASALPTEARAQKKQKAKKVLHSNLNAATAVTSVEAALEVMNVDDLPRESSAPVNAIKFTGKRAWSPSRPLEDSSDEDDINPIITSTLYDPTEPALPPLEPDFSSSLPPTSLEALVLSTFTPIRDQNIFSLTLDEIDVLSGGSSSSQRTKAVAVILRPRDTLCLLGTYTLRVVRGAVSLDSTYLYPSPVFHQVFAPRSAPLPVIRHESLPGTAPPANPNSIPRRVVSQIGPDDVVLVLRELRTGVESLGNIQPRFSGVFRQKMRDGHADIHDIDLNGIHIIKFSSSSLQPFELPRSWEVALAEAAPTVHEVPFSVEFTIQDPPVFIVRGPKKTGKSTFSRTLLNRLFARYHRVAFLETDLGQSEFTPAGMVALTVLSNPVFGPSFTHPIISHTAHFIGATSPRDAPGHYIAAIEACLQNYRLDIARAVELPTMDAFSEDDSRMADAIPLVVNTMGWSKGLGADLNSKITSLVSPTHVFDFAAFDHPDRTGGYVYVEPTVPYGGTTGAEVRYILEPMSSSLSTLFTAADNRSLNILSYFHAVFPTTNEDPRNVMACKWTNTPLISRAPYEINWRTALSGGLILSAPGSEDIVPGEVAHVLPGAIVALTALAPGVEHGIPPDGPQDVACTSTSSMPALGYVQGREPPAPLSSHCLGLALIRGVSLPAKQAQPRNPPSYSSSDAHHPSATDTTTTLTGLVPIPTPMQNAVAQLITPLPAAMLGSAHHAVKGALELPIWGMLDPSGQDEIAGWPTARVPYLRWSGRGEEEAHGTERRRVRRNLMRKAHA